MALHEVEGAGEDLVLLLLPVVKPSCLAEAAEQPGGLRRCLFRVAASNTCLSCCAVHSNRLFSWPFRASHPHQTQAGTSEYKALAERYNLSSAQMASQIAALCSAKVLGQGLKLAGRAMSREKLVTTLEGLYDFDTGLMPKIGFGRDRRIGALGAYIVTIDQRGKQFRFVTGWLGLD